MSLFAIAISPTLVNELVEIDFAISFAKMNPALGEV